MKIGIPKESRVLEGRVALTPEACAELVRHGHEVRVQSGAGLLSGYQDEDYRAKGVEIIGELADLLAETELFIKVKEPSGEELSLLRADQTLFCFLHLAANAELANRLQSIGLTAIAFETVSREAKLPLLAPMSDIAGRVAAQVGTHLLHQPQGGRGILLGGMPGTRRGHAVVIGGGVAGSSATEVLAALGARVTVFDRSRDKLQHLYRQNPNITALYPYHAELERSVAEADLVVGAVLIPGANTPKLVSRDMVKTMKKSCVIIDISVDQGGCVETTRPTSYDAPTYIEEEVIHFGVTNMPGAVPRTASQALSAALLPYVLILADNGLENDHILQDAINIKAGEITHPVVKSSLE